MESDGVVADKSVEQSSEPAPVEQQNNGHEESAVLDVTPSKKAKLDETPEGESVVKRRSSGRPKKNRDEEMMAEAKAAYGELDTSGGRSMRKRPDPPKVEPKKPVVRKNSKKSPAKAEDKTEKMEESEEKDEAKVDKKSEKDAEATEEKDKSTNAKEDSSSKTTEVKTDDAVVSVAEVTANAATSDATPETVGAGNNTTTIEKTDVAPTESTDDKATVSTAIASDVSKVDTEQTENGDNEKKVAEATETNGVATVVVSSE